MILSNVQLQEAMESGRLVIDPPPRPMRPTEGQKCPYDTHSVNLRLGNELSEPVSGPYTDPEKFMPFSVRTQHCRCF